MNNDDLKKLREICTEGWIGGRNPDQVDSMNARNKVYTAAESIDTLIEHIQNYLSEDVVSMELITDIVERLTDIKTELESEA